MEKTPAPGTVQSTRELPDLGVTVVRFSNGVEAWLKPTDFKNDQVAVHDVRARRRVARAACGLPRRVARDRVRRTSPASAA